MSVRGDWVEKGIVCHKLIGDAIRVPMSQKCTGKEPDAIPRNGVLLSRAGMRGLEKKCLIESCLTEEFRSLQPSYYRKEEANASETGKPNCNGCPSILIPGRVAWTKSQRRINQ